MIEGARGRPIRPPVEPVATKPSLANARPSVQDGPDKVRRRGPFSDVRAVEPPPATPDQITRLGELGVTVTGPVTASVAQRAVDYLGSEDRSGTGFLVESWTAPDLEEAVGLLEDMSAVGVELGSSPYVPRQWSLDEIRQVHGVVDTMADQAQSSFLADHSQDELERLATHYGLPPERAGDAALALLLEGDTVQILRDAGPNVHYVLDGQTVRRDAEGNPVVWRRYREGDGPWHQYDPSTETPPQGAETRPSVWYARADAADQIVFGGGAFFAGTQTAPTRGGFTFTSDSLIAHEIAHNIVGTYAGFARTFDELSDGVLDDDSHGSYTAADGTSLSLAANSSGYEHAPRSSDAGDEESADLVANGLLGTFTADDEGRARAEQFRILVRRLFADNRPELPPHREGPPE